MNAEPEQMTLDLWEMRPRCLVIVPDLSFEEFAEGPWASVRGVHESINWYLGDALAYAEANFGERASQLLDERLTPARMAQLKWLAEAIPPARRREDCSWTAHRYVAGLFSRRRGIFPAAYLDRKAEHQDRLLARCAAEGWHSDRMKAEVEALEEEALASIERRNDYASNDEIPERAKADDPARKSGDVEAIGKALAPASDGSAGEEITRQTSGCGSAERRCPVGEPAAETPPGTDNPVSHGDAGGSPATASFAGEKINVRAAESTAGDTPADRDELRACIEAVRATPLVAEARIAAALRRPALDLNSTDRVLTAFPPDWRLRIDQQIEDSGKTRWSVLAMKAGTQRALGFNAVLSFAVAEAALGAMLSDMPPEPVPDRPVVTGSLSLAPKRERPAPLPLPQVQHADTPLLAAFFAAPDDDRVKLRKWVLHGFVLGEPEPNGAGSRTFVEAWLAADETERKPFRVAVINLEQAA